MENDSSKRLKKLKKKCLKGEIFALDNYFECRQNGIQAVPEITFGAEQSRSYSKYDLHLSELRSLLLSLAMDKACPKYFQIKNKPFIRTVILLHFSDCPDIHSLAPDLGSGQLIKTKINRSNDTECTFLPLKLLTVAPDEAAALLSSEKLDKSEPSLDAKVSSGSQGYLTSLLPYVLSPSQLKLWGYPLRQCHSSVATIESSEVDEPAPKRLKTDISIDPGVYAGSLPTRLEAESTLSKLGFLTSETAAGQEFDCTTLPAIVLQSEVSLSIAAIDCEMVETAPGVPEIARVTVVDQDASVVLDVLVKPPRTVTNYLTNYSGITEKMLADVTTTLAQVQLALLKLIHQDSILIGHSLDSDLRALHLTHDRCIDTSVLYPHPRGFPLRYKLKQLASDYLKIKIQEGSAGHDSAEDARTALRLALLKADNGPLFGLGKRHEGRLPLSRFWKSNDTRVMLCCQAISDENAVVSAKNAEEGSVLDYAGTDESNEKANNRDSTDSMLSYPHNMDSLIAGDILTSLSTDANQVVGAASEFIAQGCDKSVAYRRESDKVDIVIAALKFTNIDNVKSIMRTIEGAIGESGRHGLILTTLQKSFEEAFKLKRQKKTCLNNLMSSVVWSKEAEMRLQHEVEECNLAGLLMKIV